MRQLISAALILFYVTFVEAQQDAHYTQFMYNNMLNNPGFTGSRRVSSVYALYRNQWMGFDGNPRSYLMSAELPISNKRFATGVVVHKQTEGIINRTSGNLSASYDLINTKKTSLRIGLNMGVRQYRFDLQNPDVYVRERSDPSIDYDKPTLVNMNIGMGVYFDSENFYCGISSPNLNKNPITLRSDAASKDLIGTEHRHFYAMGGGLIPIGSDKIMFKPAIMFKYVENAPWSVDANFSLMFNKIVTSGVSFRFGESNFSGESIDFLTFVQAMDNLGIGVAYDLTLTKIRSYSQGTIEALVRYDFGADSKKLHNPRFFF